MCADGRGSVISPILDALRSKGPKAVEATALRASRKPLSIPPTVFVGTNVRRTDNLK